MISDSRSASLRTYAGDTSLPGGKVDPEDKTIEDTAVSSGSASLFILFKTGDDNSAEKPSKR